MRTTQYYFECRSKSAAELYVVEGKHAANAVNGVRNKAVQSVLAMQGKVPNVAKRGLQQQIDKNLYVRQLITILESWASASDTSSVAQRYRNVVILSDPDGDGLHAAMLLICLIGGAFPSLVSESCLLLCRCPLYLIASDKSDEEVVLYEESQLVRYRTQHDSKRIQRFKGVASLSSQLLRSACIDPLTRTVSVVSEADFVAIRNRLS